jgi:hypothetical protein
LTRAAAQVDGLVDDAVTLKMLPPDVDREALLPPLRRVFAQGRLAAATFQKEREHAEGGGGGVGGALHEYTAVAEKRTRRASDFTWLDFASDPT